MNKKLRRLALLVLTLCFAGSMALLANADTLAEDEELIGSAWCEKCQAETVHLMKGYVHQTCTEPGYSGDIYCSVCRTLLETGEVKDPEHTFEYTTSKVDWAWRNDDGTITLSGSLKCMFCEERYDAGSISCGYDGSEQIAYTVVHEATCKGNEVRNYYYAGQFDYDIPTQDYEVPNTKLNHGFGENGPSEYVLTGSYNNVKLMAKGVCAAGGEPCEEKVAGVVISSENMDDATCQKNDHIRYYVDGNDAVEDLVLEIPNSTVEHSSADDDGEFIWSFDSKTETASLVFSADCQWCGIHISDQCPQEYIVKEVLQEANCEREKKIRFWMLNDPEQSYVKEGVFSIPGSKLSHAFGDNGPTEYVWSGEYGKIKLTAKGICESCNKLFSEDVPEEYISVDQLNDATCQKNGHARYYVKTNPAIKDYTVEIPDSKSSHNYKATYYYYLGDYGRFTCVRPNQIEITRVAVYCQTLGCNAHEEIDCSGLILDLEENVQTTCETDGYYVVPAFAVKTLDGQEVQVESKQYNEKAGHFFIEENAEFHWAGYGDDVKLWFDLPCERCGTLYEGEETVFPLEYISFEVQQEPTCQKNKVVRYWALNDPECEIVPEYVVEIPDSKADHEGDDHGPYQFVWSMTSKYPHTVSLTAVGRCEWCKEMVAEVEVPEEYIRSEIVKKETCTTNRIEHYWCTLDPDNYACEIPDYTVEIPGTGMHHNATVWSYDIDFTSDTTATVEFVCDFICSECGYVNNYHTVPVKVDAIEAKRPTCLNDGYVVVPDVSADQQITGDKVTTIIPIIRKGGTIDLPRASVHTPSSERVGVVEATCTTAGYTGDLYCTKCGGLAESGREVSALGHDYSSYYFNNDATCTIGGTGTAYCRRCGETETVSFSDALGHKAELVNAKAATCMSEGYTGDSVCNVCGKVLTRGKTVAVTDHKAVRVNAKAATCTAEGYTGDTVCGMCGKSMSQGEAIAATGHSFTAVDEAYSICTGCGAEQGTPRLTVVEDVVVEQPVNAPAASLVVRTTAAPAAESSATAVESNEPKILIIEYIPEVVIEAAEADQQEEGELTIQLPAEQVEGYVLYLVQEDGTKIKVPVVFEDGKAVIRLNHKLNFRSNWVIRMERAEQA